MPERITRVGILTALHKPHAEESTHALVRALHEGGAQVLVDERMADLGLEGCEYCPRADWGRHSELIIAMGGDGTLLAATRAAGPAGCPVLGVDLGGFGFLAERKLEHVIEALPALLAGEFETDDRMMLSAQVQAGDEGRGEYFALNDVVIGKSEPMRLVHLDAWVDGNFVTDYPADGLIVSTATGSTAYNLSAGGPLVDPLLDCFILVPICAHSLYTRPLVISPRSELRVVLCARSKPNPPIGLTVDGQVNVPLGPGEDILITAAPFRARLVRLGGGDGFYGRLREKLNWGVER
ncbi:MAG TPA: NAD(+)/NADH kinase [Armatimonadota bacterium]|jgi:NAD+ kinase